MAAPIVLVPGFWLGAWAWDEVAAALRTDGHDVTALTLPGLESVDVDRSSIGLSDHVDAICAAVSAAGAPVVLAVHSGAGAPGYVVTDRIPEQIAAMVYVDTGPASAALDAVVDDERRDHGPLEARVGGRVTERRDARHHGAAPARGHGARARVARLVLGGRRLADVDPAAVEADPDVRLRCLPRDQPSVPAPRAALELVGLEPAREVDAQIAVVVGVHASDPTV